MVKKIVIAVSLLLFVFALSAGCVAEEKTEERTVAVGDTISVYYTLTLEDGTVHESNVGKTPLTFVVGSGKMIKGFDAGVVGMKVNETKTVHLAPSQAYGEIADSMIKEMSLSEVKASTGQDVAVGSAFRATVDAGNGPVSMIAKVMSVDLSTDTVRIAFVGHPLAGENLTFEITVASIQ